MLVTTKKAAGLRPVNSLQIATRLWPVEKLANMPAYGRLQRLQYAGEWRPTAGSLQIAAGLRPVKSLQFHRRVIPEHVDSENIKIKIGHRSSVYQLLKNRDFYFIKCC
jgi:hypothetical protein